MLRTRMGRCGEYANCFTFLCRAMGFAARLVVATFDHVWTEVYSVAQKRWLHVDPSDNVIDAPLMYQHGWKRSVDYVMAYSKDDVQDVTHRYANNHDEVSIKPIKFRIWKYLNFTISVENEANPLHGRRTPASHYALAPQTPSEIL